MGIPEYWLRSLSGSYFWRVRVCVCKFDNTQQGRVFEVSTSERSDHVIGWIGAFFFLFSSLEKHIRSQNFTHSNSYLVSSSDSCLNMFFKQSHFFFMSVQAMLSLECLHDFSFFLFPIMNSPNNR